MADLKLFNQTITNVKTQEYLASVLGENKQAFVNNMTALVSNDKALQACEPMTLMFAGLKATALGLPLDNNLGFAYVLPYRNNKENKTEAQLQMGYKGIVQLAIRSGQFETINVTDVREGELKKRNRMTGEIDVEWIDNDVTRSKLPIVGYIGYFKLLSGYSKTTYWSVEELKQHGVRYSQTFRKGYGVWNDNFDAMAKKGLALDTPIPTPNGFTTIGELKIGDVIYNALGEETKVIAKSEVKHLPCYKITYQNGDSIICDNEHRWFVNNAHLSKSLRGDWKVLDSHDLYNIKMLGFPLVVPRTAPVKMEEKELPIRPYHLGYWLGNGSKRHSNVSCDKQDYNEIASQYEKDYNISFREDTRSNSVCINISSLTGKRLDNSSFKTRLEELGVLNNKHIPSIYKRSSIEQRLDLIRGLCDSDGCIDKTRGRVKYGSVDEKLVDDVYEILCSLGEHPTKHSRIATGFGKKVEYFSVEWLPIFNPFILSRKRDKVKQRKIDTCDSIKSIEKVESVPTQCIAVDYGNATDDADLRFSYLVGDGFHVTHNTVLKLMLNKGDAPMSVEMQQAVKYDQSVIIDEAGRHRYCDNEKPTAEEKLEAIARAEKQAEEVEVIEVEVETVK